MSRIFIDVFPPERRGPTSAGDDAALAAACLMVEAAGLDDDFAPAERARITGLLRRHFRLGDEAAAGLLARAETITAESVQQQGFTSVLKEKLDPDARVAVIEMLWEVAYVDGELHDNESNMMRRVAGLLYVGDRESGEARKRVLDRLGVTDEA